MVQTDEERKKKARDRAKKYLNSAKGKAKDKARKQTPAYKAKAKARKQTPAYKAWRKEYDSRLKNKAKAKTRKQTSEYKTRAKNFAEQNRLKILQEYSKRHSKSDVPCCRCCGEHSHVDFLSIDHILGKKEMDLIPELVEMGYSSKLTDLKLSNWIIDNNFPEYFQILCHNCNTAKGLKDNNNKCPLEGKPH